MPPLYSLARLCALCGYRRGAHFGFDENLRCCDRYGNDTVGTVFAPSNPPRYAARGYHPPGTHNHNPAQHRELPAPPSYEPERAPTPSEHFFGTTPCEHCGLTYGAHASGTDHCPAEGGWSQNTFSCRSPGADPGGNDSVCMVCDERLDQHRAEPGHFACTRPGSMSGRFHPYNPPLIRHVSRPRLRATMTMVQGTLQIEDEASPQPGTGNLNGKPFDWRTTPHLSELADKVNQVASKLYEKYGRSILKEVTLDRDAALGMGIPSEAELMTAAGPVKVKMDRPIATDPLFGVDRTQAPESDGIEMRMRSWANIVPTPRRVRVALPDE